MRCEPAEEDRQDDNPMTVEVPLVESNIDGTTTQVFSYLRLLHVFLSN